MLTLLDLSTKVDLFGVQVDDRAAREDVPRVQAAGFLGLTLAVPDTAVASFALPQLSWEPMRDEATSPVTALAALPATDGVPTSIQAIGIPPRADKQHLVPLAPEPVLLRTLGNVAAGASLHARFSLPFGMIADIRQANHPPVNDNPTLFQQEGVVFALVRPTFDVGRGAFQLTLKPPRPAEINAQFCGSTTLSTDGAAPGYGFRVLGDDVSGMFEAKFGSNGGVPVRRADLAGYGASIFSEWLNPKAASTDIIKVHFDTVVGRTSYEVVKAQTTLYPHAPRLVRTVTIARQPAGWVRRTDSGWVAASHGIYKFPNPAFTPALVNRGAVAGVFNVRNVREFETVAAGAFTYRRALFDADVGIDHRVKVPAGGQASSLTDLDGNPVTLVPARDMTGYVQILPVGADPGPADLAALFAVVGPIIDSIACTAEIGHIAALPGTALRCSGVSFAMTPGPGPALAAALLSAPVLPRDGAWGFARRAANAAAPTPLPKGVPVPLVQPRSDPSTWHFADMEDVLRLASPASRYGLVQDTGTQKVLFEQPLVKELGGAPPGAVPSIQLPAGVAPALADVGALLGATGLFPDIAKTISKLGAAVEQLKTIPEGLHYTREITFDGDEDPNTLLDLDVLAVALIYADTGAGKTAGKWSKPTRISFNVDPAHTLPDSNGRNWWLTIEPISFVVTIPTFGAAPLLTIVGGFAADDRSKPGLTNLTIDYGAALDSLKTLFQQIADLGELPAGRCRRGPRRVALGGTAYRARHLCAAHPAARPRRAVGH